MRHTLLLFAITLLSACASKPKCGNPEGARSVLAGASTCQVRIRQVNIGTDFNIPESLKEKLTPDFALEWQEARLVNGQIEVGHFVLVPFSNDAKAAK